MAQIESLYRYPVKGLSGESLNQLRLEKGKGVSFDRCWAIENGTEKFDAKNPQFLPKRTFLQLALNEKLALLKCHFIEDTQTLVISHDNNEVLRTSMSSAAGAEAIESFIEEFMKDSPLGKPRWVSAENGHQFTDIREKAVSLVNLASVDEISQVTDKKISPLRFRANIYVKGSKPWAEMDWVGKTVYVDGQPVFEVFSVTGRCPATQVNLETGVRDVPMLDVLNENFGHTKCGVYMTVINDVLIKPACLVEVM